MSSLHDKLQKMKKMKKETVILFKHFGLSNKNSNYSYSETANAFIGSGYTSQAGNTYFKALRLVDGIVVKENVGQGHTHTFLNGIRIFDIKTKTLLCERSYHCRFYDKSFILQEITELLFNLLIDTAKKRHMHINNYDVHKQIKGLVSKSFATDQREMLINQNQKYLK